MCSPGFGPHNYKITTITIIMMILIIIIKATESGAESQTMLNVMTFTKWLSFGPWTYRKVVTFDFPTIHFPESQHPETMAHL